MAVIVQKQIKPNLAGVAFSTSPFDGEKAIVESFCGLGDAVVGGEVTPESYYFSKKDKADKNIIGKVFSASQELEQKVGYPVDIEWAYDGTLYFLQMRPLTSAPASLKEVSGEWQEYVYRDFSYFNQCIQAEAAQKTNQEKVFGFSIPVFEGLLIDGHEFYSKVNDEKTYRVWEKLDKGDFFEQFIKKIYFSVEKTKFRVKKLQRLDLSNFSDSLLLKKYRNEMAWYLKSYLPLMMRPDDYLQEKINESIGNVAAENLLYTVTYPIKKTYYSSEKFDFLKMAISYKSGFIGAIERYLEKYEWINSPLGKKFSYLKRDDVEQRVAEISQSECAEKLNNLIKTRKKNLVLRRQKFLSIKDEKVKRLLTLISEFTHIRTFTTENSDRYFYYIKKKFLNEIAQRKNIAIEKLLLCSPLEVEQIFFDRTSIKVCEKRRDGITFVFSENGYRTYVGNGLALLKKLLPNKREAGMIKGAVACSGYVCSTVKIVKDIADIGKIIKGEILVTKMTTPELVGAMERAVGIITDEGGITCHAAIIAREYAVPCLVGTKDATSVLKDGMRVELDCIHGVCRIVNEG